VPVYRRACARAREPAYGCKFPVGARLLLRCRPWCMFRAEAFTHDNRRKIDNANRAYPHTLRRLKGHVSTQEPTGGRSVDGRGLYPRGVRPHARQQRLKVGERRVECVVCVDVCAQCGAAKQPNVVACDRATAACRHATCIHANVPLGPCSHAGMQRAPYDADGTPTSVALRFRLALLSRVRYVGRHYEQRRTEDTACGSAVGLPLR
jgi:hypothetical protein